MRITLTPREAKWLGETMLEQPNGPHQRAILTQLGLKNQKKEDKSTTKTKKKRKTPLREMTNE